MTEREQIKNEVLTIVAEALRAGEQRDGSNWDHMGRAAAVVERAITKEPLDLPTIQWEHFADACTVEPKRLQTCDQVNALRKLAQLIICSKARIVEVDK
jgi:hypothetical protein